VLLIARWGFICAFLLLSALVQADCENSIYPNNAEQDLLAQPAAAKELLRIAKTEEAPCAMVAQDLAQLYFWGGAELNPNINTAYRFAELSRADGHWPYTLRFLRSVFVLLALDNSYSPNEALRQFQREIHSGDALRRDKALAALNQLADLQPRLRLTNPVFSNKELSDPLPATGAAVVLANHQGLLRLLIADTMGAPQLAWTKASTHSELSAGEVGAAPLFFQRSPSLHATGAEDSRQQLWWPPQTSPQTGILISRFRQRDGSLYESRCTASQLSAAWLLSAAHCLYAADGSQLLLSLNYIARPLLASAQTAVPISAAWQHKTHRMEDLQLGNVGRYSGSDLAVYKLQRPVSSGNIPNVILAAPSLRQGETWVASFAYPSDKVRNSLWASRCRAMLWQRGELNLSDVYALDCFSYAGQSGAALLQENTEKLNAPLQIVGILSSRISNDEINQPVFAALNSRLIADIHRLIAAQSSEVKDFKEVAIGLSLAESP